MKTKFDKNYPLEGFSYHLVSSGCYEVTYESEYDNKIGRYWRARITDTELIHNVFRTENPKRKDIEHLRYLVKRGGSFRWELPW